MSDFFDTIAFLWTGALRPISRHLGLAVLAAALVASAGCDDGGSRVASAESATSTTAAEVSAVVTVPVSAAPTTSTTSVTTTTSPVAVSVSEPAVDRPTEAFDRRVGPDGAQVHVRCAGQGGTTVLLIAGFDGDAEGWTAVESALADDARVCAYERLGTGSSDPATATATFTSQATDLHALLETVDEPGPYVLVGHSFGGAEAVTFASMYGDEVAGLVLVDASPTTWPAALCAVADDGSEGASLLRSICTDAYPADGNSERLDVVPAFEEVSRIDSLGSLPMAVVTATHRQLPADLAAAEVERLDAAWNQGQLDWLALSTQAHLVPVDGTGHHIEIERPAVVIDEITQLLA